MSGLAQHVEDYLRMRRALGFKLDFAGHVLPQFVEYLEAAGASRVTVELAIAWAGQPTNTLPICRAHRLGAVRGFARYLATIDPTTEIPPPGVWPTSSPRPMPYLWSEEEILVLLEATSQLRPRLRAITHQSLFGLLAVTGMRIGEAVRLAREDVDLDHGVLLLRDAKFNRDRLVPVHGTTVEALYSYARARDELFPNPRSATFFLTSVGTALTTGGVQASFNQLAVATGLRGAHAHPRIHDLRHSFALRTLINWQRAGVDISAKMVVLSTYLGHVSLQGTYWYLSAVPELMGPVAARLDVGFGGRS